MARYIFLYNIAKPKFNFKTIFNADMDQFVLVCSKTCLEHLSVENKAVFENIICLDEFSFSAVEAALSPYLKTTSDLKILTNEESCAVVCAKLREKYHLGGPTVIQVLPFVDKIVMKEKLLTGTLRKPKYINFSYSEYTQKPQQYTSSIETELGYPMIAKPIEGFGSMDTVKLFNSNDLENYLKKNAQPDRKFEIDEFIEGDLYHCDGLVKDNNLLLFLCGRHNTPCMNFAKGSPLGSIVVNDQNSLKSRLATFTQEVIEILQPPDGAFHLEVFVNNREEIIFLEIAARSPGASIVPTYEKMFNINLEEQHYRLNMNLPVSTALQFNALYYAWIMFPKKEGTVTGFNKPSMTSQYKIDYLVNLNQSGQTPESILDVDSIMFLWNESYDKLFQDFMSLESFTPVNYEAE